MTDLKTLKDISFGEVGYDVEDDKVREIIRQEAIKWVKYFEQDKTIAVRLFNDNKKRKGNPIGIAKYGDEERKIINKEKIEFLIKFFNITEENLK